MTTRDPATTAADLVKLYDRRVELARAFAQAPRPTGVMADAVLAAGEELDAACERFRRDYYPRRHRVIVGLRYVMVVSKTGRSREVVYEPHGGAL